jgi:hypothetical protein
MHVSRFLSTRCCWSSRRFGSNVVQRQSGRGGGHDVLRAERATGAPPGWALGGIALVVGAVGITNVLVIAVLARRREIGVRRALGPTRRHVAAPSALLWGARRWSAVVCGVSKKIRRLTMSPSRRSCWSVAGTWQALHSLAKAASTGVLCGGVGPDTDGLTHKGEPPLWSAGRGGDRLRRSQAPVVGRGCLVSTGDAIGRRHSTASHLNPSRG